jgi:hypothetical protein
VEERISDLARLLGTDHPAAPDTTALPDIHQLGIDHVGASHDGGGHWVITTDIFLSDTNVVSMAGR